MDCMVPYNYMPPEGRDISDYLSSEANKFKIHFENEILLSWLSLEIMRKNV